MFEARLQQGSLLRKLVEGMKEVVSDVNFEISHENGIAMQAMDSSHVALVSLLLRPECFEPFRCDRARSLGINLANLAKVLKCSGTDDTITMKADDDGDVLSLMFENEQTDRISEFELKLMEIDSEALGIPESDAAATVQLGSSEFQRLVRDLSSIGANVSVSVTKDGVKFATSGDVGSANFTLKPGGEQRGAVDGKDSKKKEVPTIIEMHEPVAMSFAMRFFVSFAKAASLSEKVSLQLTKDQPIMVEFKLEEAGYLRYYLAPKIDDDEANGQAPEGGEDNDD